MEFFDELIMCLQQECRDVSKMRLSDETAREFFSASERPVISSPTASSLEQFAASSKEKHTSASPTPSAKPSRQPLVNPLTATPSPTVTAQESRPPMPVTQIDWSQFTTIDELMNFAQGCQRCNLCHERKNVVFGEGNPEAELLFIGEGPGADEDASGRPFVGKAGELLTKMITAMQFSREEVYIANIVKCRPPGNRDPQDNEAALCLGILRRQIELIKPRVIVTLGNIPLRFLLRLDKITRERGKWQRYGDIPVMPTFHPAYLLRNESAKRDVWNDLLQVMKIFGKIPNIRR